MNELNKILGQAPSMLREQGSARAKLEALWRIMAYGRNGRQTRVAGNLAERWATTQESPRVPVDDLRKAAKRLKRCLSGETAFSLDFSLTFIDEALPGGGKGAGVPRGAPASPDLVDVLSTDRQHDERMDHLRFALANVRHASITAEHLEAAAMAFDGDSSSSKQPAAALRKMANERRGAA